MMKSSVNRASLSLLMLSIGLLHVAMSQENNMTVPCQLSSPNCYCDNLPEVYCTGLSEFPTALPNPSATAIVFDRCEFDTLRPSDMTPFVQLQRLAVTRSNVRLIEAHTFDSLTNLHSLDLSYNRLIHGPDTFTGPEQLEELSLKGNNLTITPNLKDLKNLEKLWLSDNWNMIFDMEHILPNSLREVYLDHCRLFVVPYWKFLNAIRYVRIFNLDYNFLSVLDKSQFVYLNDVETLSLEHNFLRQISEHAFEGMRKIRNLRLGYNNISYIDDETFETFDNDMETLILNNNRLKSLSEKAVGTRNNLKEIRLGSNPWNCDCNVHWMRDLSENIVADEDEFTCVTPANVEGWHVRNVTSTLSCDPPNKGWLITITVIFVVGCLGLIGVAIFCIYKKKKEQAANQRAQGVKYSEVYRDPTERSHR